MHRDQVSPVLWVGSVLMSTFLPIIIFSPKSVKAPQKRTTPHLHTGQLGPLTSHYQGQEEWKQRESVVSPHWVQNIRERARYCVTRSGGGLWKLLLPAAPVSGKRWSRTLAWHPPDNCPNPLLVWAHTRTHTRGAPPVHGAEQPTKSSYVARRHMAFPVSVCSTQHSLTAVRDHPPRDVDALGAVGDEQEKATTGVRHSGTAAAAFGTDICRSQPRVLTAVRSLPRLSEKERTFPQRLCATPSRKAGLGVQRKVPFIRWSRTVPLRERHSGVGGPRRFF